MEYFGSDQLIFLSIKQYIVIGTSVESSEKPFIQPFIQPFISLLFTPFSDNKP